MVILAASSFSIAGSPRSEPRVSTMLPSASVTSSAVVRAYTLVSTCWSRTTVPSGNTSAIGILMPRSVPQSASRTMTSCETSTRRRVR